MAHLNLDKEVPQMFLECWDVLVQAKQSSHKQLDLWTTIQKDIRIMVQKTYYFSRQMGQGCGRTFRRVPGRRAGTSTRRPQGAQRFAKLVPSRKAGS